MDYVLGDDHPLQPLRVKLTVDLIRQLGLDEFCTVAPARVAADDEIGIVHSRDYIETVRALSDPVARRDVAPEEAARRGFGTADNPIQDGMHQACAVVVGASLEAARAVHEGEARHAFNPAGGLHHAARGTASGFCIYNDVAVAAGWLKEQGHRVAVIDVDVHHGDGTQAIFYDDPDVLTISIHESGRYLFPGTGFTDEVGGRAAAGTKLNVPIQPYAWDEPWLAAFEAVVPAALRRFRPTVLVTQDGCDTHVLDPLAHMACSTRIWPVVGRRFHELAHELCEGRWVATGGGGYAVREVVPRAWTLFFAEMVEQPQLAAGPCLDEREYPPAPEAQERVWNFLRRDLERLSAAVGYEVTLPAD